MMLSNLSRETAMKPEVHSNTVLVASATAEEDWNLQDASVVLPGFPFFRVFLSLIRRKWFVAISTICAALVSLGISFLLPISYTATTRIMTPQQTQSATSIMMSQMMNSGLGSLAAAAGGSLLKNPNDIWVALLNSRPVADAIVQRFDLMHVYHQRDMTGARDALADNTKVISEKSGLLAISVIDRNKERAAALANAYTLELRALTKNLAVSEASQRRLFYEEQLKSAKEELITAQVAFQSIQKEKGVVQPDVQAKALIAGLAGLQAAIAAKQVEVQSLRSFSTEKNPALQVAETELQSLEAEAARLDQGTLKGEPGRPTLNQVAAVGPDYLRAEHELQYRQILFDLLMRQFDAARLDEAKNAAVIQVVEPAIPPERKSFPHRLALSLWLTAFWFCCSVSYLAAVELLKKNNTFHHAVAELKSSFHEE
jgi:capsule polysaccharide export protein KpsE/RkpR